MPIHPFQPKHKLTEEQATDIIINCRHHSQDREYAAKYGISFFHVRNMRRGGDWGDLRFKLHEQGRLPERE